MAFRIWIFLLFSIQLSSGAQNFRVRHPIPFASNASTREIFETNQNSYIGIGFALDTSNGFAINKLTAIGLDSLGNKIWEKRYGGSLPEFRNNGFTQRCMMKHQGSLYYVGCMQDTLRQIGVLVKLNYTGDTLWIKKYRSNDPQEDLIFQMITPSVDGGFLITGFFQIWGGGGQPCLLLKTDANGNELWRKKINKAAPNVLDGKAIIQDSATGKIVIGGYQYKNGNSIYDSFIITDSLGNNPIQKSYTGSGGWITDMIQTYDKKIVAVGWLYTIVTLGGQPTMQPFAVKFDLTPPYSAIWKVNGFGIYGLTNGFTGVAELSGHDLLISGILDTIDGNADRPNNQLPANIFVRFTKVDQNGVIKANKLYNYKNNDSAVRYYQGMRSFHLCKDGGWVGAIDLVNYGVNPFMFVRYDSTGCDTSPEQCKMLWTTSVREEISNKEKFAIYPNPNTTGFYFTGSALKEGVLEIHDLLGKKISTQTITAKQTSVFVDTTNLPAGLYMITVKEFNHIIYTTKIAKEN